MAQFAQLRESIREAEEAKRARAEGRRSAAAPRSNEAGGADGNHRPNDDEEEDDGSEPAEYEDVPLIDSRRRAARGVRSAPVSEPKRASSNMSERAPLLVPTGPNTNVKNVEDVTCLDSCSACCTIL